MKVQPSLPWKRLQRLWYLKSPQIYKYTWRWTRKFVIWAFSDVTSRTLLKSAPGENTVLLLFVYCTQKEARFKQDNDCSPITFLCKLPEGLPKEEHIPLWPKYWFPSLPPGIVSYRLNLLAQDCVSLRLLSTSSAPLWSRSATSPPFYRRSSCQRRFCWTF